MIGATTGASRNSFSKIVSSYFAAITREPLYYRGHVYTPKPLHVSPLIFRHYTCPETCGACCPRFELLYLPFEARPDTLHMEAFTVDFNGQHYPMVGDAQRDH